MMRSLAISVTFTASMTDRRGGVWWFQRADSFRCLMTMNKTGSTPSSAYSYLRQSISKYNVPLLMYLPALKRHFMFCMERHYWTS